MGLREDILRRMDKKRAEITELETQIRLAREYLQALEDTLKIVPKTAADAVLDQPKLRPGTALSKARDAIISAGKPLHINTLLASLGKGQSKNERAGLSGTLAAYVRRGEIFTRTAPNTFGLVGMKTGTASTELDIEPLREPDLREPRLDDEPDPEPDPFDIPQPTPPKGFGKL